MPAYAVKVTRIEERAHVFYVMAKNESDAQSEALTCACNFNFEDAFLSYVEYSPWGANKIEEE